VLGVQAGASTEHLTPNTVYSLALNCCSVERGGYPSLS
jgi:hypothetical protein